MPASPFELLSGDFDELADRTASELGAIVAKNPGFLSYRAGRTQTATIVALNEWETKEQAEAAIPAAAEWVNSNLAGKVRLIRPGVVDFHYSHRP